MNNYIGINGVARKPKNIYIGVNGVARKVKNIYIGVNEVARKGYSESKNYIYNRGKFGNFTSGFHIGGWNYSGATKKSTFQYTSDSIACNFNKYACLVTDNMINFKNYSKLCIEYNFKSGWSKFRVYITEERDADAENNEMQKYQNKPEVEHGTPENIYIAELAIGNYVSDAYIWWRPAGIGYESDSDNILEGPRLYRMWLEE